MTRHDSADGVADRVHEQVAALARAFDEESPDGLSADRLVHLLHRALPTADACAVTLLRPGRAPQMLAATGPEAREVDDLQFRLGEGPCLEAASEATVTMSTDLGTDPHWPRFGPRCVEEIGMRSVLGARLPLGGQDTAAMNFFAVEPGAFGEVQVEVAKLLGPTAALAVQRELHAQDVENLQRALATAQGIGRAVGIVMARRLVDGDEAMDILRRASQHENRRVSEIAAEVELTGEVPDAGRSAR